MSAQSKALNARLALIRRELMWAEAFIEYGRCDLVEQYLSLIHNLSRPEAKAEVQTPAKEAA